MKTWRARILVPHHSIEQREGASPAASTKPELGVALCECIMSQFLPRQYSDTVVIVVHLSPHVHVHERKTRVLPPRQSSRCHREVRQTGIGNTTTRTTTSWRSPSVRYNRNARLMGADTFTVCIVRFMYARRSSQHSLWRGEQHAAMLDNLGADMNTGADGGEWQDMAGTGRVPQCES